MRFLFVFDEMLGRVICNCAAPVLCCCAQAVFKVFDTEGSGQINRLEFKRGLEKLDFEVKRAFEGATGGTMSRC